MYFADNPQHIINAYVDSEEGIDRAGGFAIQVRRNSVISATDVESDILGIGRHSYTKN